MSKYSTFFPTGGTGGGGSTPTNRLNRRIFAGVLTSCSWPVPEGTTSVEVHVWGGGGGGCSTGQVVDTLGVSGGGGGGGYARANLNVTDSDILSITVGDEGQTSSVTVPTQSPGSPISATGGSNGSSSPTPCAPGGSGGSGSVSLSPTQPTVYCFTASGGCGGAGVCFVNNIYPCNAVAFLGAGGAAGSPLGPGGNGGCGLPTTSPCFSPCLSEQNASGGGGIGGPGACNGGGAKYGSSRLSGGGGVDDQFNNLGGIADGYFSGQFATCSQDTWWKVEDIKGAGGLSGNQAVSFSTPMTGGTGAGGGGGAWGCGVSKCSNPNPSSKSPNVGFLVQGARGGFLGGAGGVINACTHFCSPTCPTGAPTLNCCVLYRPGIDGKGGCAGGSSGSPGTPGVVIIYW